MQSTNVYDENIDGLMLEKFVIQHRPLVKKIALFLKRRLPSHIEFDDLLQSGLVGLLEARKNYKSDLGVTFETFASIRIRGSIIDSLRRNSWVTRNALKNMKNISSAISKIEQRNNKHATSDEIAIELGLSAEEHAKISQEISICHVMNIDELGHENAHFEDDASNPQAITQHEGLKKQINSIISGLPEREQQVLSLYYVDEFTFKQIGEILDLTEARICQLHSQAIARVRIKLKNDNIVGSGDISSK